MSKPETRLLRTHRERIRLLRKYGLTYGQYLALVRRQGGVCAICDRPPKTVSLHVDHDHKTKRVRGLLCSQCNYRLVPQRHTAKLLRAAAEYVASDFDGRDLPPLADDAAPYDEKVDKTRIRHLALKALSETRLDRYLAEPGIDAVKITPLKRGSGGRCGPDVLVMTFDTYKRLHG